MLPFNHATFQFKIQIKVNRLLLRDNFEQNMLFYSKASLKIYSKSVSFHFIF